MNEDKGRYKPAGYSDSPRHLFYLSHGLDGLLVRGEVHVGLTGRPAEVVKHHVHVERVDRPKKLHTKPHTSVNALLLI